MVAPVAFCDECSANPCDVHIRNMDGHEYHFCSTACMDAFTSKDSSDEHFAIYMTSEAPGGLPNGTIVEKVNSEPGDAHPDGTVGTVVGSIGPGFVQQFGREMRAYFVQWPNMAIPIGVADHRVRKKEGA